jgi:ribonuclease HIII
MSQSTQVFRYNPEQASSLSEALTAAGYTFKSLAYAKFQARCDGVTVSLYNSGKLVVQGQDPTAWANQFLNGAAPLEKKVSAAPPVNQDQSSLGSDEAGKGDSFGGLVVCAVAAPESELIHLSKAGVSDSKRIPDDRIRVLAPWIRSNFQVAEIILSPEQYNLQRLQCHENVNRLLTKMHAEAIQSLYLQTGINHAIVDCFSAERPVAKQLKRTVPQLEVAEVPKAERFLAVAAASILARENFLVMMKELSEQWAMDIPLGSGTPVPRALRKFLEIHGTSKLDQVAKVHFKNVIRILEERRWH